MRKGEPKLVVRVPSKKQTEKAAKSKRHRMANQKGDVDVIVFVMAIARDSEQDPTSLDIMSRVAKVVDGVRGVLHDRKCHPEGAECPEDCVGSPS